MKHTSTPWIAKLYAPDKDGRPHWGVRQSPDVPSVSVDGTLLPCQFCICEIVEQDMEDIENGEEKANAEFIVTACNAHDELVAENERLKEALNKIVDTPPMLTIVKPFISSKTCPRCQDIRGIARAALKKASII